VYHRERPDPSDRRVVHERYGVVLEPEVQVLGDVEWPDDWSLDG